MDLGMIGLGKMGANMVRRLRRAGHRVVGYNRTVEVADALAVETGMEAVSTISALVEALPQPRAVWIMVPAGSVTQSTIDELARCMASGDIVVDGGNSNYKDTVRRSQVLADKGLHLVDVGTSGGVWGRDEGYSLMVGGDREAVDPLRAIFQTLAPASDRGWGHVGPSGAGHFVKMIHNGIEYGLMQAYAEGFEILQRKTQFDLDLQQVAEVWRFGSVVRSWLLDLTARALSEDASLSRIKDWVADSGEGRWTVFEAVDLDVPAPVITLALQARLASRQESSYAAKLLSALRSQFGGHEVRSNEET
jgi:6-phosphogluconate dehydrogenase